MTSVAEVTWSSVGQHFIPQWISPGIAFGCLLVTCRIVTTQLLLLEDLKIRCNCTIWGLHHIMSLQITQPECLPVSLCCCHEKFSTYFGIRYTYLSNLTSAFEVGGEQHRPFPVLKSATKLHFTHKHICSSVVFWLLKKNNLIGQTPPASFSTLWSVFTALPHSENDSDKTTKFRALVFYVLRWCSYK